VDVTSTPKPVNKSVTPAAKTSNSSKPSSAPKQGASGKVLVAIIVGIVVLAAIVLTRPDSEDSTARPTPSATAAPTMSAEPTAPAEPTATAQATSAPVTDIEGPRAIGNWKDSAQSVMTISWKAPTAVDGLTGYTVELRVNRGEWTVKSEVPAGQLSADFSKSATDGETSFRVSSIYSDGQVAIGNAFGFKGVFE
jgi:hypothetical protein